MTHVLARWARLFERVARWAGIRDFIAEFPGFSLNLCRTPPAPHAIDTPASHVLVSAEGFEYDPGDYGDLSIKDVAAENLPSPY
jgi:hypothetical protein